MTDRSAPGAGAGPAPEPRETVYSKDYWDNVFEQVGRRPMVKIALAVLALLYASAVYAPLIANDRPLVLEAVDYGEFEKAQKTLYAVAASVQRLAGTTEEEFREGLSETAVTRDYGTALRAELSALRDRLATMRGSLAGDFEEPLDELEEKVVAAVDAALAGRHEEAAEVAGEARTLAREARTEFAPRDPADPESEGVELQPTTRYPILEATTWVEVFFMWLWALLLTWPLWNRFVNGVLLRGNRARIRRARRTKAAAVLGSSAVVAALWAALVGGEMSFESSTIKGDIAKGDIVPTRAVFPPLAMGYAENRLTEAIRPPTWDAEAEVSEEGYYLHGSRAVQESPDTSTVPPASPVEVFDVEPDLNSPWRHLLGTDFMGRDLLARILYGGRISLLVGILSTVLLVFIGIVFGAVAGYFGGWVDILISRTIEVFQAVPAFFLILVAVAMIPEENLHPMFAIVFFIAVVRWTGVARLVRGEFLRLHEQEFVVAAQALGFANRRVIFRHVLPNALGPVFVAAAFSVAAGILTESSISFLGLGVQHPTPSWGSLLNEAKGAVEFWWLQIFPGVLIFVTVFCYNVVGEGLRDAMDPRRKV